MCRRRIGHWLAAVLLLIISIFSASAEWCENKEYVTANCSMPTPTMSCTTYLITNTSGTVVSGNLTLIQNDIYYFNVTVPEGDYVALLCDGTTRDFKVIEGGDEKMTIITISILLPFLISALVIFLASKLSSEEHPQLVIFMYLSSLIGILYGLYMSIQAISIFYPSLVDFVKDIVIFIWILVTLFATVIVYLIAFVLKKTWEGVAQKKNEEEGY